MDCLVLIWITESLVSGLPSFIPENAERNYYAPFIILSRSSGDLCWVTSSPKGCLQRPSLLALDSFGKLLWWDNFHISLAAVQVGRWLGAGRWTVHITKFRSISWAGNPGRNIIQKSCVLCVPSKRSGTIYIMEYQPRLQSHSPLIGNVVQEALVFSLTWYLPIPSARLPQRKPARNLHCS